MDVLLIILIYMAISLLISLGAKKAREEQRRKAEEKPKKDSSPVQEHEQKMMNGENDMTQGFFDQFPALWDAFEKQLKGHIVDALAAKASEEGSDSRKTKLSSVYWNIGCAYWCNSTGAGSHWKTQLEEVFFEHRYYNTIKQLDQFSDLDALVARRMKCLEPLDVQEQYRLLVKPLFDERKETLMAGFAEMEKELNNPLPYTLKIPLNSQQMELMLGFQKRYKKRSWGGMDGYTYSFNGRTYRDIQAFRTPGIEKLSENVSIARDTFGELVLRRYTDIPTFDSSDREWDGEELEHLMFDGKDIHLIIMRGGYRIAHLIFFEKLLTADVRMKPIFEKLGWPTNGIKWI